MDVFSNTVILSVTYGYFGSDLIVIAHKVHLIVYLLYGSDFILMIILDGYFILLFRNGYNVLDVVLISWLFLFCCLTLVQRFWPKFDDSSTRKHISFDGSFHLSHSLITCYFLPIDYVQSASH